jgi:hypothetical protein
MIEVPRAQDVYPTPGHTLVSLFFSIFILYFIGLLRVVILCEVLTGTSITMMEVYTYVGQKYCFY